MRSLLNRHKNISVLILGLLMLIACSVSAASEQDYVSEAVPKIKFDKSTHDFGVLNRGDKVYVEFRYTNVGNAPLKIKEIYSPCGCTAFEASSEALLPGDKSVIKVRFDTTDKRGPQKQPITVITNEPDDNVKTLILLADVFVELDLLPGTFVKSGVLPGSVVTKNIRLINNGSKNLKILSIKSSKPEVKLVLKSNRLNKLSQEELQLFISIPEDVGRKFTARVLITTTHPLYKTLELKIILDIAGGKKKLPKVNTRLKVPLKKK